LAEQLKVDFRSAMISAADRALLEFVETLSLRPWTISRPAVEALRRSGCSDLDILQVVLGCSHFNYLNRMADGLGIRLDYQSDLVELESPYPAGLGQGGTALPAGVTGWLRLPEAEEVPTLPGEPARLIQAIGANPAAQALTLEWHRFQLRGTNEFDGKLRTRIALFVSALARSSYGVHHYGRRLERLAEGPVPRGLAEGAIPGEVSVRERTVLTHAARLTQTPWTVRRDHVEELKDLGYDDHAVLRLTMLVAYLAFEARLAFGLGLAPEPHA
jgi:uncharacterized protein YciW